MTTSKIKWIKTNHRGLRYYEHPTRRHGKKPDRYYSVRFKVDGKDHSYGIGWLSDGVPNDIREKQNNIGFEEYCLTLLREYRHNTKSHSGPRSPKEKKQTVQARRQAEADEAARLEREQVTLNQFFDGQYTTHSSVNKKASSVKREEILYRKWIKPMLGDLAMKDISPFHVEKLKSRMKAQEQSDRSIEYALALVRQIYNIAILYGAYAGMTPLKGVKIPKPDNKRERFLTKTEAGALLTRLKAKSKDVHDMALLALFAGLRFGEIAALTWADVDLKGKILLIRDAKAGTRHAFLTEQLVEMFKEHNQGKPSELVFKKREEDEVKKESKIPRISPTFFRVVEDLKLNEGIEDPRLKVTFHSLRHTFASWLIEEGIDLYAVQRALGHKTNIMTQRYAHISDSRLRFAADTLEQVWQKEKAKRDDTKVIDLA